MTDQRERVSTDPGIGPVDADNTATLRSIEAAVEVEPDGASLYYEPLPLVAVSDHRTLEMETIKLSQDIDPRKLPTQLSLPRSPVPPQYDSGWPQAEVVLMSSQRPAPPRRWRVPVVLCALLGALLLLVVARGVAQRSAERNAASASLRVEAVPLPGPVPVVMRPATLEPVTALSVAAPTASVAPALSAPAASHAVTHALLLPQHTAPKSAPQPSVSSSALGASTVKPKRAIY